jgi:hypothetical protein
MIRSWSVFLADKHDHDALLTNQNEEEIVISPNAQFVVTSECNLNNEDGYHYVDLMEKRQEKVVF